MKDWFVYIIETTDSKLYTGITTSVERRWDEHCSGKGAKFFRGRKPKNLVFVRMVKGRAVASKLESQIKSFTRARKLNLLADQSNIASDWPNLVELRHGS